MLGTPAPLCPQLDTRLFQRASSLNSCPPVHAPSYFQMHMNGGPVPCSAAFQRGASTGPCVTNRSSMLGTGWVSEPPKHQPLPQVTGQAPDTDMQVVPPMKGTGIPGPSEEPESRTGESKGSAAAGGGLGQSTEPSRTQHLHLQVKRWAGTPTLHPTLASDILGPVACSGKGHLEPGATALQSRPTPEDLSRWGGCRLGGRDTALRVRSCRLPSGIPSSARSLIGDH